MSVECSKCSYVIATAPDGRHAPWCPRCGSDLKAGRTSLPSARIPAAPFPAADVALAPTPVIESLAVPHAGSEERPPSAGPSGQAPSDQPEEVFTTKVLWQGVAWGAALVCLGIVWVAVSQLLHPPPNRLPQTGAIYGVLGLFGAGTLLSAYVALRMRQQKYVVFADRLVEYQAGRATTARWDQIREVYHAVHPAWQKYRIHTRKGHVMTVTGEVRNHTRLGGLVGERVAEVLLPDALRRLEDGQTLGFGPVEISRAGLMVHNQHVPWHEVLSLTFRLNPYPVKGTGMLSNMIHLCVSPACMAEMGEIPNYALLERLIRRCHPSCLP